MLGARFSFPEMDSADAEQQPASNSHPVSVEKNLYAETLKSWCDGLIAHQVTELHDHALHGGLLCPACGLIHGRCGDAVYPLLRMAHTTGNEKYLRAALMVH